MKRLFLGIDIGSGSCKVSLIDQEGAFVGSASREYHPLSPRPGWYEQDPRDWYAAAVETLGRLCRERGVDPHSVAGVGCTGQMKGATFLGEDGEPVRNTILWNDLRNIAEVEDLLSAHGDILGRISLNPINCTCTLAKARWLMRHEPGNWKRTRKILFPKDYVSFRLTGSMQTDLTEASAICFFNQAEQGWWPEAVIRKLDFPPAVLPDFHPSSAVVGQVSPSAAADTGLGAGVPVVAGGSDATVESLAIGHVRPGQCKIRLGTAGALVLVVDSLRSISRGKYYVWSHVVPGLWMLDNNTRACAQATAWFREVFLHDVESSDAAFQLMSAEAASVDAGCDGLVFHPYLMGEDSPYWDPRLKGSFFGMLATHGRPHFARAVYEGTAFALRDAASGFGGLPGPAAEYLMVGGGTRSPVWTGIIADVLGIEAKIPSHADASVGAAMLAGMGAGAFASVGEAVQACVRFWDTVAADPRRHERYTELFDRYREMKKAFDRIYAL